MQHEALLELAESIKAQGVMQPILVRPSSEGGYEIIAGERRWRAARMAGLATVPVLVRDIPDQQALAAALIENIQREDLNPLEEAQGIQRLIKEFGLTHQNDRRNAGPLARRSFQSAAPAGARAARCASCSRKAGSTWGTRGRCSRCRSRARSTSPVKRRRRGSPCVRSSSASRPL